MMLTNSAGAALSSKRSGIFSLIYTYRSKQRGFFSLLFESSSSSESAKIEISLSLSLLKNQGLLSLSFRARGCFSVVFECERDDLREEATPNETLNIIKP